MAVALALSGCDLLKKKTQKDVSSQIKQKLNELQQNINLSKVSPPVAALPSKDIVEDWKNLFTPSDRELFKPFEASDMSTANVFQQTYHLTVKGVVIVDLPKAIIAVEETIFRVSKGQQIFDMEVVDINPLGVEVRRSYKKVFIKVGEMKEI